MNRYIKSNTACEDDEDGNADLTLTFDQKTNSADFCTQVDVDNERLIAEGIRKAFPDHEIIGEEGVGTGEVPKLKPGNKTWIIDPIDGTTNFSMSLAMTCVSIGLCDENGKPVMGVIYAPATDDWYVAVSNYGAFCNGKRIIPGKRRIKKDLSEAVLCCELGYSRKQEEIDAMLGAMSRILANGCRAIRGFGSGCLDLCYVATGQLDIVYAGIVNEGWKPWDYAAGLVICTESGCVMESIDQETPGEFDLYSKSILCGGSRELVDECRKLLRESQFLKEELDC